MRRIAVPPAGGAMLSACIPVFPAAEPSGAVSIFIFPVKYFPVSGYAAVCGGISPLPFAFSEFSREFENIVAVPHINIAAAAADSIATAAHSDFAEGSRYFPAASGGRECHRGRQGAVRARRFYMRRRGFCTLCGICAPFRGRGARIWKANASPRRLPRRPNRRRQAPRIFPWKSSLGREKGVYARFSSSTLRNSLARESLLLTVPTLIPNSAAISS